MVGLDLDLPGERRPSALHARLRPAIIFFTYFYVAITFNPEEVADNMKKYGGFIPGIRAGKPTAEYLNYVLSRITLPGALYLGMISLIPLIALVLVIANQNFPFGGTSILIMVGVGARHREADREPAPAAQLRRVPPLMQLTPHRFRRARMRLAALASVTIPQGPRKA